MSEKFIVTTTISSPTKAIDLFSKKKDWNLIVVGDLKTPHGDYQNIDCIYLHPDTQQSNYPDLSNIIGWNTIQRRNIGFIEAYKRGAQIVATVDDDNIPYDDWGSDLYVGKTINVSCYSNDGEVFDPLSIVGEVWHRGFPPQLLDKRNVHYDGETKRRVLVQADLWDGDPDVDAIARLVYRPKVKYDIQKPYCSNTIAPFNSQNTFLAREILPYYAVFPFVGRMCDIWGGLFLQTLFPNCVVYNRASVFHDRHIHNLIADMEGEMIGYKKTLSLIRQWKRFTTLICPIGTPKKTMDFYQEYRKTFESI